MNTEIKRKVEKRGKRGEKSLFFFISGVTNLFIVQVKIKFNPDQEIK